MKSYFAAWIAILFVVIAPVAFAEECEGWISLFDGETLEGWKASENPESVWVEDGMIVCHGPRAHLFYLGPVEAHTFKNFEFKIDAMAYPGANSGVYFHTEYQEEGWPGKGHEAQINHSQESERRRTGSLYGVVDILESPVEDHEWFNLHIIVKEKNVKIIIDGEIVVNYTQPDDYVAPENRPGRILDSGTFALQAHDPDSRVLFKNIYVKPLELD